MTSKFMKLNQLVVPMITLVLLVSQLTGCALFNREDTEKILEENEQVELVIPDKDDTEENLEYTGSEKPNEDEEDGDIGVIEDEGILSGAELEELFQTVYDKIHPLYKQRGYTTDAQLLEEELGQIKFYAPGINGEEYLPKDYKEQYKAWRPADAGDWVNQLQAETPSAPQSQSQPQSQPAPSKPSNSQTPSSTSKPSTNNTGTQSKPSGNPNTVTDGSTIRDLNENPEKVHDPTEGITQEQIDNAYNGEGTIYG